MTVFKKNKMMTLYDKFIADQKDQINLQLDHFLKYEIGKIETENIKLKAEIMRLNAEIERLEKRIEELSK